MERKQVVFNFGRFYGLLKSHPHADKKTLVFGVTGGETDDLKLVTKQEYKCLCDSLDDSRNIEQWRHSGSIMLALLQDIGVNTRDWNAVDKYLMQPRIFSGICRHPKRYIQTTTEERERLIKRFRLILKKNEEKGIDRSIPKYKLN